MVKKSFVSANLVVILIVALAHTFIHYSVFSATADSGKTISGFSINEVEADSAGTFSLSLLVIGFEWATLLFVMIFSATRERINTNVSHPIQIDKERMRKIAKSGTEMDMLYELLRSNHSLKVSQIEKLFEVEKEEVIAWGKTLSEANLITFNYSRVGEAELVIK